MLKLLDTLRLLGLVLVIINVSINLLGYADIKVLQYLLGAVIVAYFILFFRHKFKPFR